MTTTYTKVPKASGTSYTKITIPTHGVATQGSPIAAGFFLYLTYPATKGTNYTKTTKAAGTIYTKITKAI